MAASPPDAEILVDGKPIGTGVTAHELFVAPGAYTLRARLSGHGEVSQRVEVAAGMTVGAALQLARAAETPARAPEPGARKSEPVRPAAAAAAPVAAPGPWASRPGTLRIAGVAATMATVSTGTVFMLRANRLDGDLDERIDGLHRDPAWTSGACREAPQPPACPELQRMREQRDRSGALGTVLVATGAVVGAVTAASFIIDLSLRSTPARSGLHVVPVRRRSRSAWWRSGGGEGAWKAGMEGEVRGGGRAALWRGPPGRASLRRRRLVVRCARPDDHHRPGAGVGPGPGPRRGRANVVQVEAAEGSASDGKSSTVRRALRWQSSPQGRYRSSGRASRCPCMPGCARSRCR
ncbi:PEGA domain-containing protein [Sorangium sp. So ce216]